MGAPSATGLSLPVSGTVAQVQSALATPIDRYRLSSGKIGYHNRAAPQVPASVAPQIQGILGLDTLSPPQPTTSVPAASASGSAPRALGVTPEGAPGQPDPTGPTCTIGPQNSVSYAESSYGALDAPELAQAYSFDPLYSSSDYGAGTTVALVELGGAGYSSSDITTFADCYGITLGVGQVTEKSVLGGGSGSNVEAELDIETVLSLAPKANIEVYEGGTSASMYDVVNQIETDDTAKIVSISWTNGCEAYVPSAYQSSENTLFQAAATEGQSVFAAAGDQGSEGCNVNTAIADQTGSHPVAQVADPSTGTLYVANESSGSVSVDSEGSSGNPSSAVNPVATVSAGSGPDAVALDSTDGKVFVANGGSSSVTALATSTCNQSTTGGCTSTATINSGLSGPTALAVRGSTLYVANSSGTVAVYNASTDAYVTSVSLPASSSPTSLAVDAANGVVYVGDAGAVSRVDYFNATTCNASVTTGCSTIPATISLPQDPVSMVVDDGAGSLYVADGGSGGGIAVVSLSTHALTTTIATSGAGIAGTGKAQSVALSPNGTQVLAVLDGLQFPGDVLATINPVSQTIVATANLETNNDTMGALAVDGSRDYVWVTDVSKADDVVQNLNLAVSDPASQPYVTAVGGTTVSALGPAPTESTWNDQLYYAEGAGGGGISKSFTMPAYQQALGMVSGSSGTPCANSSGDCREVPDVSADADPSTGYVIYDSGWTAIGGTSGAAPLWAAVLSVAASADGNTDGYGAMNPILYTLAGQTPGTYLNDVTTGNNDYNGTDGGQFGATGGYDMATGLGTPVTSALATGLSKIPLDVAVSGSQVYGGSPTFGATVKFAGSSSAPFGVTLRTAGLSCTEVGTSTPISPTLAIGSDTLLTSSCSGASLSGADAADYTVVYTSASGDFTVSPAPVDIAVSGSQTYGGSPAFSGTASPPPGVTVSTASLSCTEVYALTVITPTLAAGSYRLIPALCTGASLSGTGASDYEVAYTSVAGDFTVASAPLDRHRLERVHDLRGNAARHQPHLQRLRQLRERVVAHDQAHLHHSGHQLQPRVGLAVHLVVHGGRRPELHVHLRPRVRRGQRGTAHDRGLERAYDLRGNAAGHQRHLQRLRQLRHRVVAHDQAHLHHGGHQLQPRVGLAVHVVVHGGRRFELHLYLRHGLGHGGPGITDRCPRQHLHDLRGNPAGHQRHLQRLRQLRHRVVAHDPAHLHHGGHQLQPRVGVAVHLVVHGGGRPELHLHLRRRRGRRQQGSPDHHGLEQRHDLRRHPSGHHAGLRRLRQRRHRLVAHHEADVLDHGH